MSGVMSKKKKIIFGIGYLLCSLIIVCIVSGVINEKRSSQYYAIELQNVVSSIPDNFIEDDESSYYKKDNVFYITEKDNAYFISGMELQNLSESDVGSDYIFSSESLKLLQNANSNGSIIDGIREGIGLLGQVEKMGSIEKPSYTMYYFSSSEELEGKSYQAYILFLIQGDIKYMQINLVDEEHLLTDKQKEHMRLMTGRYK